jgi:hypothetical protein
VRFCEQVISDPNHVLIPEGSTPAKELGPLQVGRRKFRLLLSG